MVKLPRSVTICVLSRPSNGTAAFAKLVLVDPLAAQSLAFCSIPDSRLSPLRTQSVLSARSAYTSISSSKKPARRRNSQSRTKISPHVEKIIKDYTEFLFPSASWF